MDSTTLPFDIQIFGNLSQISNRLDVIGNDFLEELTTSQWFFLAILSNYPTNPPTIKEMSENMGSSHQNVKQLALRLQKKGYINIKRDEKDGRSLRLSFTPKALEYAKSFDEKGKKFLYLLYKNFKEEDKEVFCHYTSLLLSTLKEMQETKSYKNC